MAGAFSVLVRRRQRSRGRCQGKGGGQVARIAGQSQSAFCADPASHPGDWCRGDGRRRACLAWRELTFFGVDALCFCGGSRSEEHTSELQSLMRNSYAVFCLKKKNK